jgi:hypothetical protein
MSSESIRVTQDLAQKSLYFRRFTDGFDIHWLAAKIVEDPKREI